MPDVTVGVREEDDGTFTGYCSDDVPGDPCRGYRTSGWPTRDTAAARIRQHKAQHDTRDVAALQPLDEFLADHGLAKSGDGRTAVQVPDDEKVE